MSLNLVRARLSLMFNYDIEVLKRETKINIRTMKKRRKELDESTKERFRN